MPPWTPYEVGLIFVKKNKKWIQEQISAHTPELLKHGGKIGKKHQLTFINQPAKDGVVGTRVSSTKIVIKTSLDPAIASIQKKISQACERALKQEAEILLSKRLELISRDNGLPYGNLKIRRLTSRWGSCSSKQEITLSYFLIQLPWDLIDYVILHELAHTIFHNHSREFWDFMEERVPNLRGVKAQIKLHRPRIEPY